MSRRITDEVDADPEIVGGGGGEARDVKLLPVEAAGRHGHKVGRGRKEKLSTELGNMFMEMFFPDDPFRSYKDQPAPKRLLLGIEALFPIVNWIRQYSLSKFKGDLIAGLTIASLAIPQDLGYAKLAHLPPENGLCEYALSRAFSPPLFFGISFCLGASEFFHARPHSTFDDFYR
ncbi:hypothetical protein Dimus_026408 [Dionaea muscipula]